MSPLWWVLLVAVCTAGSGFLVYFIMRSRMEVVLSRQREELAAVRATLEARRESLETSLRNAEESTRRQALDEFMAEIRVEERSYVREHKAFFLTRKSLIRQERIYFRNLPLSNWVEQEMPFEEGADIEQLAQTMAVFNAAALAEPEKAPIRKLIR
ncbi:MAG: hypothetical protein QOJ99_1787 [Bryobacterales bacterium]|jgi:hypothetical protein|nr:hypothetical protein [Bryobacterales bacterium]